MYYYTRDKYVHLQTGANNDRIQEAEEFRISRVSVYRKRRGGSLKPR